MSTLVSNDLSPPQRWLVGEKQKNEQKNEKNGSRKTREKRVRKTEKNGSA